MSVMASPVQCPGQSDLDSPIAQLHEHRNRLRIGLRSHSRGSSVLGSIVALVSLERSMVELVLTRERHKAP